MNSNELKNFCNNLELYGENYAITRGVQKPTEKDEEELTKYARSQTALIEREEFNPNKKIDDCHHISEIENKLSKRQNIEDSYNIAIGNLISAERENDIRANTYMPSTARVEIVISAIVFLTLTIFPTLHDFIFSISTYDIIASITLSILCSASIGTFITLSLIGTIDVDEGRSYKYNVGFIGGLIISIGLGLFRFAGSDGTDSIAFSYAFTLLEIGTVILLGKYGAALREQYQEWKTLDKERRYFQGTVESAYKELGRRELMRDEINESLKNDYKYIKERFNQYSNILEIETLAIQSILSGYRKGIAKNMGRILGVKEGQL